MIPLLALCLALQAQPPADATSALSAARERLAAPETYPEAIELYRLALARDPDSIDARIELARVLSWAGRNDEAIAEYDRLLELQPAHQQARVERAEVLSWSGRYTEAREALDGVLATEPEHARALRALARVHRWSGDPSGADRAYLAALAREEDAEARAEWEELRQGYRPAFGLDLRARGDSDSFERFDAVARHTRWIDLATRLELRAGHVRAARPRHKAAPAARQEHGHDRAQELALRAVRRLNSRVELETELGARTWRFAPDRAQGFAELRLAQSSATAWTLRLQQGEWIDVVDSFEAGEEGLQHTSAHAALWRQLSRRFESWTGVDVSRVSDGNRRENAATSLGFRPREDHALTLSLVAGATRVANRSPYYYDPELDLGLGLRLEDRFALTRALSLRLAAGAGPARSRVNDDTDYGTQLNGLAELRFVRGPWSAGLTVEAMRAQRSEPYRMSWGRLEIERSF